MTDRTEQQLRELFAADAAGAPHPGGLAALALHEVRRRRRARRTAAAGLIAAVVAVGGSAVVWGPLGPSSSPAAAPTGVGELPGSSAGDCTGYSPAGLAAHLTEEGAFAFDGTVTGIEPGADLGPETPSQDADVTFRVHTWYSGGSGETVDVYLDDPSVMGMDSEVSAYGIGTRLLVSGLLTRTERAPGAEPAPGDLHHFGASCGYTRYYDEATAAEWAAVAAGDAPAGALPADGAVSCPEYSPALVAQQDFALDGTVTDIGEQRFSREPGAEAYYSVTFRVHAWFRGGTGETVTLHMDSDLPTSERSVDDYWVGTRLLISGMVSDVEGQGLIGQGCGYTRYHDAATAAEWAAATD